MDYKKEYERWLQSATDEDIRAELQGMDDAAIEDAFYRDLAFGTGGLRGTIGAGTNRMNIYVVAKASQGLANYLLSTSNAPSVVIGYDSRIKSDVFAKTAAGVTRLSTCEKSARSPNYTRHGTPHPASTLNIEPTAA